MLAKQLQGAAKGVAVDSDFENVTLLLHGNGTNGAQNNTFIDGSSNAFSITRNGNTTQGTFSPYGSNWSNYFDGTGDYLSVADNTALTLTANFTIECWIYPTAGAADRLIISKWGGAAEYYIFIQTNNVIGFAWGPYNASGLYGGALLLSGNNAFALNTWSHVAVVRNSNTFTLYVNGTSVATATNSATVTDGAEPVTIGDYNGGGFGFAGYISNARIVKGTAVYTAAFTPPTAPLTAVTNTQLLTCQSNRFIDNSTNAFTITRNGDVSVQRFSPFSPTAAYASGTIGGSGYFDGTGDYLTASNNAALQLGSSDFTIESWFYFTQTPNSYNALCQKGIAGDSNLEYAVFLRPSSNTIEFGYSTNGSTYLFISSSSVTINQNVWYHVAVARSGNTLYFFLNGVAAGSSSFTSTLYTGTASLGIAASNSGTNILAAAYLSNLRIVKGTAVYTTGFTPPTSPVTAITNTSLLLNFTNAGIIDNAMMNDLETVGNAQISTTQSKFGGSSMYFDETGDYLTAPSTQNVAFGTGNFTIECWVRFATSTVGNGQGVFQLSNGYLNSAVRGPAVGTDDTSGKWAIYYGTSSSVHATSIPSTNTWYHVAFVRNSSTSKLYIDGTELISVSDSTNYTDTNFTIGGWYSSSYLLNGYIDDLRITKGVARYTANFTAPTAPFADQ